MRNCNNCRHFYECDNMGYHESCLPDMKNFEPRTDEGMDKVLKAFQRYTDYMNNHGHDDVIDSVVEEEGILLITMRGHMGETYALRAYISGENEELCIENSEKESVFDYIDAEEYGLTDKIIAMIKYGKQ